MIIQYQSQYLKIPHYEQPHSKGRAVNFCKLTTKFWKCIPVPVPCWAFVVVPETNIQLLASITRFSLYIMKLHSYQLLKIMCRLELLLVNLSYTDISTVLTKIGLITINRFFCKSKKVTEKAKVCFTLNVTISQYLKLLR